MNRLNAPFFGRTTGLEKSVLPESSLSEDGGLVVAVGIVVTIQDSMSPRIVAGKLSLESRKAVGNIFALRPGGEKLNVRLVCPMV